MITHSGLSPPSAPFIFKHPPHRRCNCGLRRSRKREKRYWRHQRGPPLPHPSPSQNPSLNTEVLRLPPYCHRETHCHPRRAQSSSRLRLGILSMRSRHRTRKTRGGQCKLGVTQHRLRKRRLRCHLLKGPRSRRRIPQRLYCQGT